MGWINILFRNAIHTNYFDQTINQSINYYKLKLIEDQNQEESDCHINKPAAKNSYVVTVTTTIGHSLAKWQQDKSAIKPVTTMMIENRSADADIFIINKRQKTIRIKCAVRNLHHIIITILGYGYWILQ